ncbi:hypothetical protein TVAG_341190 [Trichomonas vaginalis G3]|uniref:Uncharacterized protein n=1 Tax=Trichomonas vaginalis (strain ATCC PRA-98 / G3) TaxID=412133 RepID=A2DTS8_TRIV3|nr:porin domain-containing protein [Trichomonas vaginalis G3]EAY16225.1 hypothetical protein TVAG_341190 [Trichomonas vaginalis G3]KAI5493270.1 porin domain-containing protein [Trichomonas vaginalis G3]|eukprot:XP_001328448.1 hypothetical protein [Trichomonas vaginalis G3]
MIFDPKQTKCPEFEAFESEIVGPTSLPPNNTFEIVVAKKLKDIGNLISVLSIKPRLYPLKYADQAGEQRLPGNAAVNFTTDKIGFPISIDVSRDSPILFSATMPIIDSLNLAVSTTLEKKMKMSFTLNHFNPYTNLSFNYSVADSFKTALYNFKIASGVPKKFCVGFNGAISSKGNTEYSLIGSIKANQLNLSTILSKSQNLTISFVGTHHPSDKTVSSAVLQFNPSTLQTDILFGFQRAFMSSKVSAVMNTKGSVGSVFQKDVNEKYSIIISSFADHFQKLYSLGMAVSVRDTSSD